MISKKYLSVLFVVVVVFASCSKELSSEPNYRPTPGGGGVGGGTAGIKGTWNFLFLTAKTKAVTTISSGPDERTETYSEYTSTKNQGVMTIDDTKMVSAGFGYSINTIAKAYYYESGVIIDSFDVPMNVDLKPANSTATIKHVGSDSMYISSAPFLAGPDGSALPSAPAGIKYSISNDTLSIVIRSATNSVQTAPTGEKITVVGFVDGKA